MTQRNTTRRRFLGGSLAAALAGIAGCSALGSSDGGGGGTTTGTTQQTTQSTTQSTTTATRERGPRNGDSLPTDQHPADGYPPEFEYEPDSRSVDPSTFDTVTRGDIEVKLVPVDVAYYWYVQGEARFADARSETEYHVSHILGAVPTPIMAMDNGLREAVPTYSWPKDDRIVTYCDCPHHLAAMLAADLKNRGWQTVYAIDQGFGAWRENNYPMAGSDTTRAPPERVIEGRTRSKYAGETAMVTHEPTNQVEATTIAEDGTYTLSVHFVNVTDSTEVHVETPAYELTATLGELQSGYVSVDGTVTSTAGTGNSTGTTNSTMNSTATTNSTFSSIRRP